MIYGIGVDIAKIERFEKIINAEISPFMNRVFTEEERWYLSSKKAQSIAGIFAAKEAVAKALGTGFTDISPGDIEILHDKYGKPFVTLHNSAKEIFQNLILHISISHTDTDAIAYAVAEKFDAAD
jgi:holo-[acyl-carrier-protein] synthase